jgi:hypothetical protein
LDKCGKEQFYILRAELVVSTVLCYDMFTFTENKMIKSTNITLGKSVKIGKIKSEEWLRLSKL